MKKLPALNRSVSIFNTIGVFLLAALCVAQWFANRRANLQAGALVQDLQAQSAKIPQLEKTIHGYVADLDDFRVRLTRMQAMAQADLRDAASLASVTGERNNFKAELIQHDAAMTRQLQISAEQIRRLTGERDALIAKYNQLAVKCNSLVKDLNQARADPKLKEADSQIEKLAKERNAIADQYNELVKKYNALVAQVNQARSNPSMP